jgi:uncharacterized protein with PQ loop repeat
MEFVIVAGSIAATLPQLYHTISTQSTDDFNHSYVVISFFTSILFFLHGYRRKDTTVMMLAAWFFIYWCIIGYLKFIA